MFKDQIEAGASLLDEKIPDWVAMQDLEDLDLSDTCNCVVGQSQPDKAYIDTLMELFDVSDDQVALDKSMEYGFCIPDGYDYKEYPQLTQEWIAFIEERRAQKQVTNAE